MKTPRVQDFDPNAKLPQLGSPMDNMPTIQKPPDNHIPEKKPESLNSRKEESLKGRNQDSLKTGKPEIPISGNQAILKARKPENRKVPKYSTQLEEALQIQVSIYAKMHRMKDYRLYSDLRDRKPRIQTQTKIIQRTADLHHLITCS